MCPSCLIGSKHRLGFSNQCVCVCVVCEKRTLKGRARTLHIAIILLLYDPKHGFNAFILFDDSSVVSTKLIFFVRIFVFSRKFKFFECAPTISMSGTDQTSHFPPGTKQYKTIEFEPSVCMPYDWLAHLHVCCWLLYICGADFNVRLFLSSSQACKQYQKQFFL